MVNGLNDTHVREHLPPHITPHEKSLLLSLARQTIVAALEGKPLPPLPPSPPVLQEKTGAFVSLHCHGELRGCVGIVAAEKPLDRVVREMALAAAFKDPRFLPLTKEEIPDLSIEISLLSSLRPVSAEEVIPGQHGLCILQGPHRGVLLPQVATLHGWNRDTLLTQTCLKAGLPPDAWKGQDTVILIFTAQVFGEGEPKA